MNIPFAKKDYLCTIGEKPCVLQRATRIPEIKPV